MLEIWQSFSKSFLALQCMSDVVEELSVVLVDPQSSHEDAVLGLPADITKSAFSKCHKAQYTTVNFRENKT